MNIGESFFKTTKGIQIVEDIIKAHTGTVNSFVDGKGYNHFEECAEEIYISLSSYFEDPKIYKEDELLRTPFYKDEVVSDTTLGLTEEKE